MKQTTRQRSIHELTLIMFIVGMTVILTFCGCGKRTNVTEVEQAPVVHQPVPVLPVSTTPATALECPAGGTDIAIDGSPTLTVCNGTSGTDGVNGTNGSNGLNGSSVTVVQFCQGTTTYPTAFLEVGLVIAGKMYGVYSINNGFLTYLPPGAYSSNAVGSSCNFTINADNTVSH